ncbi:MAG: beta-carotene 15,15'-dioxygenase, Brp/Blh family [Flavobacteriales bacterium]|nr:beta-carotene 15,15'-dioxygenase, Brp/Blh family [Flavobacteriales bacterium]
MIPSATIFILLVIPLSIFSHYLGSWNDPLLMVLSFTMIALVGIPHGALDHILYKRNSKSSTLYFYSFYLGCMIVFVCSWIFLPLLSLTLFILISAYHFGQSQFSDVRFRADHMHKVLYLSWGMTILSSLFYFNVNELEVLLSSYSDTIALKSFFKESVQLSVLIISGLSTSILLIRANAKKYISVRRFNQELIILFMILFAFVMLPLVIGFTLFFCIIHSMKVLGEEFTHVRKLYDIRSVLSFIKLLTPFTLLSLFGIAIIFYLQQKGFLGLSEFMLVMILVSMVTLPHSIVMEGFYNSSNNKIA